MAPVTELKETNSENEVKKSGRNRAEDVPGAFAEGLREVAEGDISVSKFPFTPSACLPRCIPFLRLCFSLIFFVFFLCSVFRTPSLSLSVRFCVRCFRLVLVRERFTFGVGF